MDYFVHIAITIALYTILATSYNLLIGYTGLFSIAHAAFYGIGAYTSALVALHWGVSFPVALLAAVLLTAVIGGAIGVPALRVRGDYLVIASFGFQMIIFGVMLNWLALTRGEGGLTGIPRPALLGIKIFSPRAYLPLAAAIAGVCFLVTWWIARSPFGRVLRAIREDEVAAQSLGKDIAYFKIAVFALAGGLAAVAGSFYAHYVTFVNPLSFTLEESIFIMAIVLVGGAGNLWGSLLGALALVVAPEALRFLRIPDAIAAPFRQILYGLLLVLFVRFRPQGLLAEHRMPRAGPEVPASGEHRAELGNRASGISPQAKSHTPIARSGRDGKVLLSLSGVSKSFGGIRALDNFSLALREGEITGLIGPNGAGKTTAFNLITGFVQPDAGSILCRGRELRGLSPHEIARLGIARSFQDLRLFPRMTVLDNVVVALPGQRGEQLWFVVVGAPQLIRAEGQNLRRAHDLLTFVGLAEKAGELAEDLSYAEQKLLALARLLATEADLLLLDEPASGLDPTSMQATMALIRRLPEYGKTVCVIEHNLDVIKGLADPVVFLNEGQAIAVGTPAEIMADPKLADIYFGG
ncbi:MAG: branched-chain amino acid ABC transporter ATP-binding protein/permease [Candidatus Rokubacteria bacterium]|nr:branched-chain amino acid ABC transporter ATP-binding protein/permease [Candidatus Rokubacteria bacterium]